MDITMLSSRYDVRRLGEPDVDDILAIYRENPQFYRYCEAKPTRAQVLSDLRVAPPGVGPENKYYVGFYYKEMPVAVMDLIDGYPTPEIVYIGFFMMNRALQGRGLGSEIVREVAAYLKRTGRAAIRLAIDRENPQSTHFWRKNGFRVVKEMDRNGWPMLVAERAL